MFSMHQSADAETNSPQSTLSICPFRNVSSAYCPAAIMKLEINNRQNAVYCTTENFDCCPVYLGKILRGTRVKPLS